MNFLFVVNGIHFMDRKSNLNIFPEQFVWKLCCYLVYKALKILQNILEIRDCFFPLPRGRRSGCNKRTFEMYQETSFLSLLQKATLLP